jgi:twinkle protein
MQGSKYPCVSVKSASSAVKDCRQEFMYLDSFEHIVVCFDKDDAKVNPQTGAVHYPGQEAARAVASMFKPGKVRILTLAQAKDANDYLMLGKAKEFVQEWWAAPAFTPAGLKLGSAMWEEINKPKNYETVTYPWDGINKATYGLRLSEFVLITAEKKVGKTTFLKEIAYHLRNNSKHGLGLMLFEETNSDTCIGLMSIAASKRLHLPDVRAGVTDEEFRGYYDSTVNTDRIVIWDHFGSNDIIEVLSKVRHMAALGCRYIILDHLSIIVSDQSGDERKQLDEISTKLKTLCMELNICVIAVIHLSRSGVIRGSAGPEQLANIVVKLHRDVLDDDPWRRNVTKVVVEANRFCGDTGPVDWLYYDKETGRMTALTEEQIKQYENAKTPAAKVEVNWKEPF